jgi:hypothetical protein
MLAKIRAFLNADPPPPARNPTQSLGQKTGQMPGYRSAQKTATQLLQPTQPTAAPRKEQQGAYHAVAVVPGPDACASARRVKGQRFLSRQAPHLPFGDCDAAHCTCKYRKFADRRQLDDRRSFMPASHRHDKTGGERRDPVGGRRSTDL